MKPITSRNEATGVALDLGRIPIPAVVVLPPVQTAGPVERGTWTRNVLNGDEGSNNLYGEGGNDALLGWGGDDYVDGGAGDDLIYGQGGADTIEPPLVSRKLESLSRRETGTNETRGLLKIRPKFLDPSVTR